MNSKPDLGGVRQSRQVQISQGPGAGLRIELAGASADYADGSNELPVQTAVVDTLRPGDVFVDVGANVGFFGLLAARKVGPAGHVLAIEAVAEVAEAARTNARLNDFAHMQVLVAAASDHEGTTELMLAQHPGGATISPDDVPPDLVGRRVVPTVTLDDLVTSGQLPPPAMVKIDVEGAEMAVLRGMSGILREHRPAILCELDSAVPSVLAEKVAAFRELMSQQGYEVRDLSPSYDGADWNVYHGLALPG
jgi:FkbM family methyltransferase